MKAETSVRIRVRDWWRGFRRRFPLWHRWWRWRRRLRKRRHTRELGALVERMQKYDHAELEWSEVEQRWDVLIQPDIFDDSTTVRSKGCNELFYTLDLLIAQIEAAD